MPTVGWPCGCCGGGCACRHTICVTGCPSGAELAGATVTVEQGGTTVDTSTTVDDGAGHACCSICLDAAGGAGPYEVIVAAPGYQPFDGTRALACGGTTAIALQPDTAGATALFDVAGCCGAALPGATITLSDGRSCTTDASGRCGFWIGAAGTYSYTISRPRFADATGSFTVPACATSTTGIGVAMAPASGYACGPTDQDSNPLPDPLPTTLSLTDSVYGGCPLTYDPANRWWYGSFTASFAGRCSCPPASFTLEYWLYQCGTQLSHLTLHVAWSSGDYTQCILGSPFLLRRGCPQGGATTTCPGKPNGAFIYALSTFVTEFNYYGGFTDWTVASPLPFDATFTVAASASCPSGTNGNALIPWPAGGTITITE